ncbi:putative actin-related protein 4 - ARP4 [Paratrimastix pyriformis]|uniref:Actin-related protein 4 - ARP4 n=1 Tax=Paratrimastix pyriformis TaxID=342808 RepID=A0ABQ8UG80_9EUKA|nr:putative actin-related protein 4 - ARP4 [Paratrimastix pyriformis]
MTTCDCAFACQLHLFGGHGGAAMARSTEKLPETDIPPFGVGSDNLRAGYAGDIRPILSLPSAAGYLEGGFFAPTILPIPSDADTPTLPAPPRKYAIGEAALKSRRENMEIRSCMQQGAVSDWNLYEALLDHTLGPALHAADHPLFLTEPVFHTRQHHEKMAEIGFERMGAPALSIGKNPALPGYALTRGHPSPNHPSPSYPQPQPPQSSHPTPNHPCPNHPCPNHPCPSPSHSVAASRVPPHSCLRSSPGVLAPRTHCSDPAKRGGREPPDSDAAPLPDPRTSSPHHLQPAPPPARTTSSPHARVPSTVVPRGYSSESETSSNHHHPIITNHPVLQPACAFQRRPDGERGVRIEPLDVSHLHPSFLHYHAMDLIRDMKQTLCLVQTGGETPGPASYPLPDGRVVTMALERAAIPQCLFNTALIPRELELIAPGATFLPATSGLPLPPCPPLDAGAAGVVPALTESLPLAALPDLVITAMGKVDPDVRREVCAATVLAGGCTLFDGFQEMMIKELNEKTPASMKTKVFTPSTKYERLIQVWLGGAVVASLSSFQQNWISKAEYQESGANIVERKTM